MSTGPLMNFSKDAQRGLAPLQDGVVVIAVVDEVEAAVSARSCAALVSGWGDELRTVFCFLRGGMLLVNGQMG